MADRILYWLLKGAERKDYLTSILPQFVKMIPKWFNHMFKNPKSCAVFLASGQNGEREEVVLFFDKAERILKDCDDSATVLCWKHRFHNIVFQSLRFQ